MPLITAAQLQIFAKRCDYVALAPHLNRACEEAGIDTPRELRHFMAQTHVESLGFTRFKENLNYSAERLHQVWPNRFPTVASAEPYAMNPGALAEKVYGGRMGNSRPGDGYLYLGRSPIQVTGHDGYVLAKAWTGVDLVKLPHLAETLPIGCRVAAQWWKHHGLNEIVAADPGEKAIADIQARLLANEMDDVLQARRRINGGTNGLQEVRNMLLRAGGIWRD